MRVFQKTCLIALAAAALVAGCSQILGLKDPDLDVAGPGMDAAIDSAVTIDSAVIDSAVIDGPPIDGPSCPASRCAFGCEADGTTCRPAKLWVIATTGAYQGDGFGGLANPPEVRTTADALCFAELSTKQGSRQCKRPQVHAVLQVSLSDSLGLMRTAYSIPDAAPVHRANDDVLVADTWDDLINTSKSPRQPVTTATTEDDGLVWSGAISSGAGSASNCSNWTSKTASGVQGHTTLLFSNWLSRSSDPCDLLAHLLCVCWTVGE